MIVWLKNPKCDKSIITKVFCTALFFISLVFVLDAQEPCNDINAYRSWRKAKRGETTEIFVDCRCRTQEGVAMGTCKVVIE